MEVGLLERAWGCEGEEGVEIAVGDGRCDGGALVGEGVVEPGRGARGAADGEDEDVEEVERLGCWNVALDDWGKWVSIHWSSTTSESLSPDMLGGVPSPFHERPMRCRGEVIEPIARKHKRKG